MKEFITMTEIRTTSTWSVKDDSPRGCKTVNNSEVKVGDMVVYENHFIPVIDDPETEAVETEIATRTAEEIIADIITYFKDNKDVFNDCMDELDEYNGYLGDNRYYSMDMLEEFYRGSDPLEILRRAYYGRDDNTWTTGSNGDKIYGEFNPNREYFYYNGYGNLVSSDYKDYSHLLDNYAIEAMNENRFDIDSIDNDEELTPLFDELEEVA